MPRISDPAPGVRPTLPTAPTAPSTTPAPQPARTGPADGFKRDAATVTGDVVIRTQKDLEQLAGVKVITGDLRIENTEVTSLKGLESLRVVQGSLRLTNNPKLTDVSAFAGPPSLGPLTVQGLKTVEQNGFAPAQLKVNVLNDVVVRTAADLAKLQGLTTFPGKLTIEGTELTDLKGLESLRHVQGDLVIRHNPKLTNLDALANLKQTLSLRIEGNPALEAAVLPSLETLSPPDARGNLGWLHVIGNPRLNEAAFPALRAIHEGGVVIQNNATLEHVDLSRLAREGKKLHAAFVDNPKLPRDLPREFVDAIDGRLPNFLSGWEKHESATSLVYRKKSGHLGGNVFVDP